MSTKVWQTPLLQSATVEQTASPAMVTLRLGIGSGCGRYNTAGASFVYTLPKRVAEDLLNDLAEALRL